MIKLSELKSNQTAQIECLECEDHAAMRLCALGFAPGTCINLFKKSVLNGPCIFEVQGCKIALRKSDADHIKVSLN